MLKESNPQRGLPILLLFASALHTYRVIIWKSSQQRNNSFEEEGRNKPLVLKPPGSLPIGLSFGKFANDWQLKAQAPQGAEGTKNPHNDPEVHDQHTSLQNDLS